MPYLGIDEQSSYIDVECDGYVFRCYYGNTEEFDAIRTIGGTIRARLRDQIRSNGVTYALSYDRDRTIIVAEDTPIRVHLRKTGEFETNAQASLDSNDVVTYDYYIYPDRIVITVTWEDAAQTIIDNSDDNKTVAIDVSAVTGEINIAEVGGVEKYHGEDAFNDPDFVRTIQTGDYIGVMGDELYYFGINLSHTDDSDFEQWCHYAGGVYMRWNDNAAFPAGTHTISVMWIIDTIDRSDITPITAWSDTNYSVEDLVVNDSIGYECISTVTSGNSGITEPGTGSDWQTYWVQCHKYTRADRLAIGNEFTNISTDLTSGNAGSPVTDRHVPATIDTTSGFCADGAFHVTSDSNNAGKFTMDRARALFATVIEDWPVMSGDPSSPTEYLTAHLKLDAAGGTSTAQLYDEVAGSWVGGGADTVTFDDGVRGNCLVADSTSDRAYIPGSYIYTDDKLTIEFDYLCTANDYDLYCFTYNSGGDSIAFQPYVQSTPLGSFSFRANYASNTASVSFTTPEINVWHHVVLGIDVTNKKLYIFIDGECALDTEYHFSDIADQSSLSGSCYIGYLAAADGTMKVDNFKTYNDLILPYGTFIPANIINGDVGYDMAHSDITAYVHGDESNGDTLKIPGSGTVTVSGATHTTGPDGVTNSAFLIDGSSESIYFPFTDNMSKGCFGCWYKETLGTPDDYACFFSHDDVTFYLCREGDHLVLRMDATTLYLNDTWTKLNDGNWHWLVVTWDDSTNVAISYVDGVKIYTRSNTSFTAPSITSGNLYVGNREVGGHEVSGAIAAITITSNPNTPQLWTANGKPLILPDFKSEVA